MPRTRRWTFTFPALATSADPVATVDGQPVVVHTEPASRRISITVDDVPATSALRLELGHRPRLRDNDVLNDVFKLLDRAQIEYQTKSKVLTVVEADQPVPVRLSRLQALNLESALFSALGEILLARAD